MKDGCAWDCYHLNQVPTVTVCVLCVILSFQHPLAVQLNQGVRAGQSAHPVGGHPVRAHARRALPAAEACGARGEPPLVRFQARRDAPSAKRRIPGLWSWATGGPARQSGKRGGAAAGRGPCARREPVRRSGNRGSPSAERGTPGLRPSATGEAEPAWQRESSEGRGWEPCEAREPTWRSGRPQWRRRQT